MAPDSCRRTSIMYFLATAIWWAGAGEMADFSASAQVCGLSPIAPAVRFGVAGSVSSTNVRKYQRPKRFTWIPVRCFTRSDRCGLYGERMDSFCDLRVLLRCFNPCCYSSPLFVCARADEWASSHTALVTRWCTNSGCLLRFTASSFSCCCINKV